MYFIDLIGKLEQKLDLRDLITKVKAKFEKYYYYFRNVKRDYRWLLMFLFARFPLGRQLGSYFYRARYSKKNIFHRVNLNSIASVDETSEASALNILNLNLFVPQYKLSLFWECGA